MRIDETKSSWAIISAHYPYFTIQQNDDRNESLKERIIDDSYSGYILDSVYNENYIKQDNILVVNNKSEDDFRFDLIRYLNSTHPLIESVIVKYKTEPVAYKLLNTGYESVFGKFKWGLNEIGTSFFIHQRPFMFEKVDNYSINYIDYKKALLYT